MRQTLIRILRHGLPVAVILGVFGYMLAEVAGMWVASQGGAGDPAGTQVTTNGEEVAQVLKYRVPLSMAGWGFAIIAVYELLLGLWRGGQRPTPTPASAPVEDEVEKLLAQILQQAEANRPGEGKTLTDTPPPAGNITPSPNPPSGEPRAVPDSVQAAPTAPRSP